MSALVLDTHSAIWFLDNSPRMSATARQAIRDALSAGEPAYVSSVTIAEIIYLVEKARLTQQQLTDLLAVLHRLDSGWIVVPFDLAIAEALPQIPRQVVPDLPDRMIAATALHLQLPLVTKDTRIQAAKIATVW